MTSVSEIWFTSDLHIGHQKVAEYRAEVMEVHWSYHDDILAAIWDKTVGKDDHVWVLGDISSGSPVGQRNALEWLQRRPGHKHLVAGNHDRVHPMYRDSHRWFPRYMEAFESVQMAARRRIPLPEGHVPALLSHFPYGRDRGEIQRYPQWRLPDMGEWLIHGHTHGTERLTLGTKAVDAEGHPPTSWHHTQEIHVGLDAWEFTPVHLDQICDLILSAGRRT
ncbi:phosphoesterase [Mycobacterium phage Kumao]|uniref:Phosphoesterase n=1 Tax=Mycobacterium phage Kumao TaxID=2041344 RepID=A0A2D1GPW3_9CAUD|nr:phosphoesterase [Mycobacterium phage Kumao]ATN94057.1 phosphoesterase [Mycobacterium phage Kumao]